MAAEKSRALVEKYCTWIKTGKGAKPNLREADLREADLREANLWGADLREADLREANLWGANLRGANLRGANLRGANLQGANLRGANLQRADLRWADLRGANLQGADLQRANLQRADLRGADLRWADLQGADLPAPTMILLADWGDLPDEITLALMRLDCSAHPVGKRAFDVWAGGGDYPYLDCRFQRVASFNEKSSLWSYGRPPSIWKCCKMVLDRCCPGWDIPLKEC